MSERLPKKEFEDTKINGGEYHLYPCLITRINESKTRIYVCKSYFDGKDFMLYGGYDIDEGPDTKNVLAWMPMPKPYKKGGKFAVEMILIILLILFIIWVCKTA